MCLVNDPQVQSGFKIYSDSDFAGMYSVNGEVRSRSGSILCYDGMPVAWRSSFQSCRMTSMSDPYAITDADIAISTGYGETVAMGETLKLGTHMSYVGDEMGAKLTYPLNIYVDASAAKGFADSVGKNTRMKHIDVRRAWIKQLRDRDFVRFMRVPGTENLADFFTKLLVGSIFTRYELEMMQWLPEERSAAGECADDVLAKGA